jgi:hypothetical protein
MSQRNPMNDRYRTDEHTGQTKKSAAKFKPAREAASSVHIEQKPRTAREKRQAAKAKEAQARQKAQAHAQKLAAREAEQTPGAEQPKQGFFAKLKGQAAINQAAKPAPVPQAQRVAPFPTTPRYKKLRRYYWILMGVGVVGVVLSLLCNVVLQGAGMLWIAPMALAYAGVVGALILDFTKIRPIVRAYQSGASQNKSPKQLKHDQEAAAQAAALQAEKKARKSSKRTKSATAARMDAMSAAPGHPADQAVDEFFKEEK